MCISWIQSPPIFFNTQELFFSIVCVVRYQWSFIVVWSPLNFEVMMSIILILAIMPHWVPVICQIVCRSMLQPLVEVILAVQKQAQYKDKPTLQKHDWLEEYGRVCLLHIKKNCLSHATFLCKLRRSAGEDKILLKLVITLVLKLQMWLVSCTFF